MAFPKFRLNSTILLVAGILCVVSSRSYADTYQILDLGSDQDYFFHAMDDSGTVVIDASAYCDTSCYNTYVNGVLTGGLLSTTPPNIVDDQGTPCTPSLPPGGSVIYGVCNNGREAFTGRLSTSQVFPDVYTVGPNFVDLVASGGEGFIFMNGLGDIVYDDHFGEEWLEALDLSTMPAPEPGSVALLGTGMLGLIEIARRRSKRESGPAIQDRRAVDRA